MKSVSSPMDGLRYGFVVLAMALGIGLAATASAGDSTRAAGSTQSDREVAADVQAASTLTCTLNFADVPTTDVFYPYVMCLACQGIIGGYPCGGEFEPCNANSDPYFRPNLPVTRGQIAKIVSISAGFNEPVPSTQETFADVAYGSTFWEYVERLASRGIMEGYACGSDTEPCDWLNRPYFRLFENTNRGQLVKVLNKAGRNEVERTSAGLGPLDNLVTRAETSKLVSDAFFPNCAP